MPPFAEILRYLQRLLADLSLHIDPLASLVAIASLVIALIADRRSRRLFAIERAREGKVDKVRIQTHSLQPMLDSPLSPLGNTPARHSDMPEGFVCSVYSGSDDVEVEGAFLRISFIEGFLGQRRYDIKVDLRSGEGMAEPPPLLPHRMPPHSRLDWIFPTFLTYFPNGRGYERVVDVLRILDAMHEQLYFEFGAYSRTSNIPVTSVAWRRVTPLPIPLKGGPWTRVITYDSLWDAVMSPSSPASLKGWFLEWLECRPDFEARIAEDKTGTLREYIRGVRSWCYWPPGQVPVGVSGSNVLVGDPDHDKTSHLLANMASGLQDKAPADRGAIVSGTGGSGSARQERIHAVFTILADGGDAGLDPREASVNATQPRDRSAPVTDQVLRAAVETRRLYERSKRQALKHTDADRLAKSRSVIRTELSKCIYFSDNECDQLIDLALQGGPGEAAESAQITDEQGRSSRVLWSHLPAGGGPVISGTTSPETS